MKHRPAHFESLMTEEERKERHRAWNFVRIFSKNTEWEEADWEDFYEGLTWAFVRIFRRHRRTFLPDPEYEI